MSAMRRPVAERRPRAGSQPIGGAPELWRQGEVEGCLPRHERGRIQQVQSERRGCEQQVAGPNGAQTVAERAEQQGREEAAKAAHGADQTGHAAGVGGKVLRHELEDRAVAESQERRAAERAHSERHHRGPCEEQRKGHDAQEHTVQHARAANPIRQPPADWTAERRQHDEVRRPEAGVGWRQTKLVFEQRRQVDREGDESTERQEVEGRQRPAQRVPGQHTHHRAEGLGLAALRRVPGEHRKNRRPDQQQAADAIHRAFPPNRDGDHGPQEHRDRLTDIAETVHAERAALPLG